MGAFTVSVTLIALLAASCNHERAAEPTKKDAVKEEKRNPKTDSTVDEKSMSTTFRADNTLGPAAFNGITKLSYADSLLRIPIPEPPLLGKAEFDKEAHTDFGELAKTTGGSFILVRKASDVANTAVRIINENLKKGTDVLFLIDQTGSMSDDIDNIKLGMKDIIRAIKKQKDIRCGMAFYGDKNEDAHWFRHTRFTYNFDTLESHIQNISATGGGDLPESVYDGFFEAMSTMNGDDSRKLMVMIIGDAHSLDSTRSTYSLQDVLAFCKKRDVHINLYPMLLATNDDRVEETTPVFADLIYMVFPNPTKGEVNFKTNRAGFYEYEIINQAGSIVRTGSLIGPEATINMSMLSNGLYAIRLIDSESRHTESHKVVLQK